MSRRLVAAPLTAAAFAPFGEVIETDGAEHFAINDGMCTRYHDLARVEAAGPNARVLISIFRGRPYPMPLALTMVERHPFGSQAFMPLSPRPFLVVVAADGAAGPERPQAFLTRPGQGVNYARNTWHAVLTPIGAEQDFLVVDRGGDGDNLEAFVFETPYAVHLPEAT
ncbi:ureidoglycolate lyase [Aquibium sp. A9E412]|uniref:ureidoglycolate lyase n=1 Tax=Aquibium sp. A9E412 TaxID=2976767 RepID=UPI0025B172E4|nr:ureidoglycolate lyase [Aquibium sp. A9E412]MDN2565163.1 ureidoglycolate lyase [Aquibium sp. A9E412]